MFNTLMISVFIFSYYLVKRCERKQTNEVENEEIFPNEVLNILG